MTFPTLHAQERHITALETFKPPNFQSQRIEQTHVQTRRCGTVNSHGHHVQLILGAGHSGPSARCRMRGVPTPQIPASVNQAATELQQCSTCIVCAYTELGFSELTYITRENYGIRNNCVPSSFNAEVGFGSRRV
jgi:hypothetical protein